MCVCMCVYVRTVFMSVRTYILCVYMCVYKCIVCVRIGNTQYICVLALSYSIILVEGTQW